jgi:hypothetical protein
MNRKVDRTRPKNSDMASFKKHIMCCCQACQYRREIEHRAELLAEVKAHFTRMSEKRASEKLSQNRGRLSDQKLPKPK